MEVLPIEFGPSTKEQAHRYGMAGTELLADLGDVGVVVSHSTDFDRASDYCDALLEGRVAHLADLQQRAASLSDEAEGAFIGKLGVGMKTSLLERAACMRRSGYPQFTNSTYLGADSMLDLLDDLGVARGTLDERGPQIPQRQEVPEGEVAVIPPPAARTYTPQHEELQLAEVFASCGAQAAFPRDVQRQSARAAASVESHYGSRGARLRHDILDALALLARPFPQEKMRR